MANIKSAQKRILIAERNHDRNVAFKSSVKTAIKKALAAANAKDSEAVAKSLSNVYKLCDKGVSKGIYKKNTAARRKSRVTKAVNKILG
ncbi:MAG: 30S ribosomal protein S20 [Candidatus Gastranaerophilaceae bacterium]